MRDRQPIAPEDGWTLANVPQWGIVVGICGGCSHIGPIDRWGAAAKFGRYVKLANLNRFLRCKACRNKRFNKIGVQPLPR
jgi:hypothetical protein